MKNVAGWKVGTFYGEPIYKTKPKDFFDDHSISWDDLCVHADYNTLALRQNFHLWN
jgi:NADH dehydrogenase (ubiquinone) 1 alpha subcomplex subunit 13